MRLLLFLVPLLFLSACKNNNQSDGSVDTDSHFFFVGTYTDGDSEGIYKYQLKKNGKLENSGLAAKTSNPSFLALSTDNNFLLAVNETADHNGHGTVESYLIKDEELTLLNRKESGGAHPCYISITENNFVLSANYTGGNIGLHKLDNNGLLSDLLDTQQHSGKGTTDRQTGPHAHSVIHEKASGLIIAADLGTNELCLSKIDEKRSKLTPSYPHKIPLDPGAGPRHIAVHPSGEFLYVINELNNTISLLKKDEKKHFILISSVSTLPSDYSGESYCADIHISSDGKFLYASNRGHNSIAIYKIIPQNGKLVPLGHQSVHGDWPRNFSLSPDDTFLLVANQKSGNITSFSRDKNSGLLKFVHEISAPDCVCIEFLN